MQPDNRSNFEFNEAAEGFREIGRICDATQNRIAVFGERPDGKFTFSIYLWDLTDFEFLGSGYWSCCDVGGIYDDQNFAQSEAERRVALRV